VRREAGGGKREARDTDQRIRALRPAKSRIDPYVAHGSLRERERRPDGTVEQTLTVFLAGAECPFTCSFCDLWRFTIDGPTPPGALTTQLRAVLDSVDRTGVERLKLYNASNFFDRRAVPAEDFSAIARLARDFAGVTVESHASTIGPRTLDLARNIQGRLEVAIGLETLHPEAGPRLNKRLDVAKFDEAAGFLAGNGIDLRVFVLLGTPHVPVTESVEWTVRTVEYAIGRGASVVSVIPVRGGNGEMERLADVGEFVAPSLADLESVLDRCARFTGAVVTADLWDIDKLAVCVSCSEARVARLRETNLTGVVSARVVCDACGAGEPAPVGAA
jgi:radical SAM enzyme (TIGR01210 family)